MKKFLLLLALAALTACNKEQSSLSLDAVNGKAKIMGTFYYSEGTSWKNGEFSELMKPASNVKVYVRIDNSTISSSANGYSVIETTTDKNGCYTVNVPAIESGTKIYIKPGDFVGKRYVVSNVNNGNVGIDELDAVFSANEVQYIVRPHDIKYHDGIYGVTTHDFNVFFPETVTFQVVVGEGSVEWSNESNRLKAFMHKKKGVNLLMTVVYNETEGATSMTRTYGATSDSKGVATFNVPAKSKTWNNVEVRVSAVPYEANVSFDSARNSSYEMHGIYKLYGTNNTFANYVTYHGSFTGIINNEVVVCEARMVFDPFYGEETNGYSPTNYSWNLTEIE